MVNVPTPTIEQIGFFLAGFLLGLPAPYWYAQERVQGFSRAVLDKLPYKPPPGKKKEEALEQAVTHEEDTADEEDE